jgi:hypothetical protein
VFAADSTTEEYRLHLCSGTLAGGCAGLNQVWESEENHTTSDGDSASVRYALHCDLDHFCTPSIVRPKALNSGGQVGFGDGDSLEILFDQVRASTYFILKPTDAVVLCQDTNTPPVSTKREIDILLHFSAKLGTNYTGRWLDRVRASATIATHHFF